MELRLRPPRASDEAQFRRAHAALAAEGFSFGGGSLGEVPWPDYLERLERSARGVRVREDGVPATFLVAVIDEEIVGRTSIRHHLNDELRHKGGHIGYGVVPSARRRGYATTILQRSLVIARSLGVNAALLTCDDDNIASVRVIERCGGVLDSIETPPRPAAPWRRYWIQ